MILFSLERRAAGNDIVSRAAGPQAAREDRVFSLWIVPVPTLSDL